MFFVRLPAVVGGLLGEPCPGGAGKVPAIIFRSKLLQCGVCTGNKLFQ